MTAQQQNRERTLDEAMPFSLNGLSYKVGLCPIDRLRPNERNARTHPRHQLEKLKTGMRRCFGAPIVVDEHHVLLAGHARLLVAKELSMEMVPVYMISGLSEARKRAYVLADNRIALDAGWDRAALSAEFSELQVLFEGKGLMIEDTGFEIAEIDQINLDLYNQSDEETINLSALDGPSVCRTGDFWNLGSHCLYVGDATAALSFDQVLAGERAACAFLDPPFNIAGSAIGGRGKVRHGNFAMASGEFSTAEFIEFLSSTHQHVARACKDGAVVFSCIDWRHVDQLMQACRPIFGAHLDTIVWNKTNAGQGSFYRSQHEFITVWKVGEGHYLNNIQMGRFGRSRSNVWTYPGANTFRAGRLDDLKAHPTVKNQNMVADALKDCSRPGDLVLDCFGGAGTTLLAAEKTGRRAAMIEIDPRYANVIIERWQAFTGRDAIHQSSELTFHALRAQRAASPVGTSVLASVPGPEEPRHG